jgi:hypothetical protein
MRVLLLTEYAHLILYPRVLSRPRLLSRPAEFRFIIGDPMVRIVNVNLVGAILLQTLAVLVVINTPSAAALTNADMVNFLAQSLCLNTAGNPTAQIPIIDNCTSMRPQRADDTAVYQKHDWPDRQVYPHYFLTGHQASDSVVISLTNRPVIEQTLDFGGDPQHHFGYFDSNDAGQIVLLVGGWASIVMTQDATGGVQWFIGSGCRGSVGGGRLSWLLFNQTIPSGSWAAIVPSLNIARSPSDCPARFNPAYTRYRREQISFPFRLVQGNTVTMTMRPVDVIITEHFNGRSPDPALDTSLERFYFCNHLGWLRWERWENLAVHNEPQFTERARDLNASARCPAVSYSTAPGPNWVRVGCRTWTTIVKPNKPWSVKDYHWKAVEDFNWSSNF